MSYRIAEFNSGESRTAAISKMERFVIIANCWKPLTIITKRSILDVAAVLDPPLVKVVKNPSTIYLPLNKYFFDGSYKEH